MKARIKDLAKKYRKQAIQWRRAIHANPELSFEEVQTSKFIASVLKKEKISFTKGWAKTGIVATIKGELPGKKVVALRADIDALPIEEKNKVSYKSKNKGMSVVPIITIREGIISISLSGISDISGFLLNTFL